MQKLYQPWLERKELNLVVTFDHKNFRLAVWLSGVNRTAQCRWAERWSVCPPSMELTRDPNYTDFVVRLPVETDLSDGEKTVVAVKEATVQLLQLLP